MAGASGTTMTEELEKRALKLIEEHGEEGILQSVLIKKLNVDSRMGSKIVTRLVKKGVIRREKVTVNGRVTYRLFLAKQATRLAEIKVDVRSILDIPCTTCRYRKECGPGNFMDPATCPILTKWLEQVAERMGKLSGANGSGGHAG